MTQVPDLFPPIDENEQIYIMFDFAPEMSSGTIIATATITCIGIFGVDLNASSRVLGVPALAPSPSSGIANQAVRQMIGDMIGGERYRIQCLARIGDGQIFSLDTHVDCNSVI